MKKIIFLAAVLILLTGTAFAEEATGIDTDAVTGELPSEISEMLPEFSETEPADFWQSLKDMLFGSLIEAKSSFRSGLGLCAILLGIVTLCSAAEISAAENCSGAVVVAGALGMTAAVMGSFQSMIVLASDTIRGMTDYNACMLPVMASTAAMSGAFSSSSAIYAGTVLFSQLLMQLITRLLIPGVYFYLCISMAEAALSRDTLSEIREFIGWLISKSLKIVLYIFVGYMTITGVISGSADSSALRATKAALSGMVPVVGGIISDASESLVASASMLRSSVGIFGMLAVLAMVLLPFFRVGIHYLLFKITAAVSGSIGLMPHVGLLKHFSEAMGYLLAMCGTCAMLMLISFACFMRVVV